MALELVSENWASWPPASSPAGVASPRISFSRDLDSSTFDHHHYHHHRSDASLLDSSSSPEFHFCVSRDPPDQDSSIADELFSDGFLLPLPLLPPRGGPIAAPPSHPNPTLATPTPPTTTTTTTTGRRPDPASPPAPTHDGKDGAKEIAAEPDEKPVVGKQPSSFWRFGRSSSLNCSGGGGGGGGGGGARMASLICSLPLLSRSKSTGSNPSPSSTLKPRHHPPFNTATTAIAAGSGSKLSRKGSGNGGAAARNPYYYGHHHHGGGGVRISPVLNVPPPYLPKGGGAGLLGLRHLLCNGRERSRKKAPPPTSP